jgi:type IV pilus assembly protein PilO
MIRDFKRAKIALLILVGALFIADSALSVVAIRSAATKQTPQHQLAIQISLLKLLRADVKRAREIQQEIPKTKADCELFENSLLAAGTGYSVISEELQDLSQKSGAQIASLSFRPQDNPQDKPSRGITEVSLDASVNGDYKSVVQFVDGLQKSKNHYVVDNLSLANDRPGPGAKSSLRVNLHLRSYLKAAA